MMKQRQSAPRKVCRPSYKIREGKSFPQYHLQNPLSRSNREKRRESGNNHKAILRNIYPDKEIRSDNASKDEKKGARPHEAEFFRAD